MIRVFVLGGTGSIGGAIVEALHKRNHQVLGLVRSAKAREHTWRIYEFFYRDLQCAQFSGL